MCHISHHTMTGVVNEDHSLHFAIAPVLSNIISQISDEILYLLKALVFYFGDVCLASSKSQETIFDVLGIIIDVWDILECLEAFHFTKQVVVAILYYHPPASLGYEVIRFVFFKTSLLYLLIDCGIYHGSNSLVIVLCKASLALGSRRHLLLFFAASHCLEFMNIAKWKPGFFSVTHFEFSDALNVICLHDCTFVGILFSFFPVGKDCIAHLPITNAGYGAL